VTEPPQPKTEAPLIQRSRSRQDDKTPKNVVIIRKGLEQRLTIEPDLDVDSLKHRIRAEFELPSHVMFTLKLSPYHRKNWKEDDRIEAQLLNAAAMLLTRTSSLETLPEEAYTVALKLNRLGCSTSLRVNQDVSDKELREQAKARFQVKAGAMLMLDIQQHGRWQEGDEIRVAIGTPERPMPAVGGLLTPKLEQQSVARPEPETPPRPEQRPMERPVTVAPRPKAEGQKSVRQPQPMKESPTKEAEVQPPPANRARGIITVNPRQTKTTGLAPRCPPQIPMKTRRGGEQRDLEMDATMMRQEIEDALKREWGINPVSRVRLSKEGVTDYSPVRGCMYDIEELPDAGWMTESDDSSDTAPAAIPKAATPVARPERG
jgi:hypothetical protein